MEKPTPSSLIDRMVWAEEDAVSDEEDEYPEALRLTVESGEAHFWSRSRAALWKKGETSGHVLRVADIRIDCDQDAVWLIVDPAGPACHTGERSCFYRRIEGDRLVSAA